MLDFISGKLSTGFQKFKASDPLPRGSLHYQQFDFNRQVVALYRHNGALTLSIRQGPLGARSRLATSHRHVQKGRT